MKSFVLFFLLLTSSIVYSKSNDSPNLQTKPTQDLEWKEWIKNLKLKLSEKSEFKKQTIDILDNLTFNKKVVELDRKQPEFTILFEQYLQRNVNKKTKTELKKKFNQNITLLKKIENKFDVDSKVIVSLWSIETNFGTYTGKFDIIRSLTSLAYDGRRKDFFMRELKLALKILDDGHILRKNFKGSWAGAFGQTQFMPSTFHKFAIDFDGNNKINLLEKEDALASGANYLKSAGWNSSLNWGEKVVLQLNPELIELSKKKKFKSLKYWKKYGIIFKNKYNDDDLFKLIIPDSKDNQCFLVSKNFDVILDWNRSNYFALSVFLLSDEIQK
ncbi:MAG: lytic transglycosylase [Rickettsiales bacterium]|nr:lytic transglycosylase [Rickettsiales bacterium]